MPSNAAVNRCSHSPSSEVVRGHIYNKSQTAVTAVDRRRRKLSALPVCTPIRPSVRRNTTFHATRHLHTYVTTVIIIIIIIVVGYHGPVRARRQSCTRQNVSQFARVTPAPPTHPPFLIPPTRGIVDPVRSRSVRSICAIQYKTKMSHSTKRIIN